MSGNGLGYDEADDVDQTISDLQDDVSALADELGDAANDSMRQTLRRIENAVADLYDTVAEQSGRGVELIEQQVDERPWTSLLVAFGIGCLFGQLIRRGR